MAGIAALASARKAARRATPTATDFFFFCPSFFLRSEPELHETVIKNTRE